MEKTCFKDDTLYSLEYEDIYYNPEYGIEESNYVFIDSLDFENTLNIKEAKPVSLLEMGLGTGLNLLLTWKKLEELKWKGNFIYHSIEGFPLPKDILEDIFNKESFKALEHYSNAFLKEYPINPKNGVLEISLTPYFKAKLYFYSVGEALNLINENFDYFYLDGFNPKNNPEMWSPSVFEKIKEVKKKGARLATFSASRIVKDGLDLAEFKWQRVKGFRNKRHRLIASYE